MTPTEEERIEAVRRYLTKEPAEDIYNDLGRTEQWFFKWVNRYDLEDPEWYKSHSCTPHKIANKTSLEIENAILGIRAKLKNANEFYGALAVQWAMEDLRYKNIPSETTIKRILKRHNRIEPRRSNNRYKPKNIPYPRVEPNGEPNLLHEMDFLGPRYLKGGFRFYSLNIMDIGTHRVALTISKNQCDYTVVETLLSSWKRLGIPRYLQMDNQLPFTGSNRYPRAFGSVIRLCLYLDVEPVFIPIREPWRNGHIERFHRTYKKMFLNKYYFDNPDELLHSSNDFESRHNEKYRYSCLKGKTPMQTFLSFGCNIKRLSEDFHIPDLKERPRQGYVHLIRFVRSNKVISIFGEKFTVPEEAVYQYVKATIDVKEQKLLLFLNGKVIDKREYRYNKS